MKPIDFRTCDFSNIKYNFGELSSWKNTIIKCPVDDLVFSISKPSTNKFSVSNKYSPTMFGFVNDNDPPKLLEQ